MDKAKIFLKFLNLGILAMIGKRYSNFRILLNDYINKISVNKNYIKKVDKYIESKKFNIDRLYFEVTNVCNGRCIFCAYRKIIKNPSQKKGVMDFDVFKKGVDEAIKMGIKKISLTPTIGDPLIDPNIFEKIEYIKMKDKNIYVYFYTNGILLNKNENYKKIIDSGINEIDISTAGFNEENWTKIFGVNNYKEHILGLSNLLRYAKQKNANIKININLRTNLNPAKLFFQEDFKKYILPYITDKVNFTYMYTYDNWGGIIQKQDLLPGMTLRRPYFFKKLPCKRLFDAAILFDGSVRLCACRVVETEFDDLVVGNIKEEPLEKIFYGEKAQTIRKNFLKGKYPNTCKECSMYAPLTI